MMSRSISTSRLKPRFVITIPVVALLSTLLSGFSNDFSGETKSANVKLSFTTQLIEETELAVIPNTGSEATETVSEVGKWKRFEVSFKNTSWSGNPFDLEFTGVFTHKLTNRTVTQFGFYAGKDTWKIYFMPDELGDWTYTTSSPDADLSGHAGTFRAVPSDLPGQLVADGNRWMLKQSQEHVAPLILATDAWFKSTETDAGVGDFVAWAADTAGALMIGTTLVFFTYPEDASPYLKGEEGDLFNIEMWDRLNSHYDALRDRGMGFYVMFYSDDKDSPDNFGVTADSIAERRLFRYALARFSPYPIVLWDTGIDIGETRDSSWVDSFTDWFLDNDPWKHPVSSRTGGGSGGKFPDQGTYFSDGSSELPAHVQVVANWNSRKVPTAFTDRWRENYSRGNFDRDKIRRAAWEVGLVGGSAIFVSGNENQGSLGEDYATDLEAAPDLGCRSWYFENQIDNLGQLVPHSEIIKSGVGVVLSANPGQEYVAYDLDGGTIELNLASASGSFNVQWFNPKTGSITSGNPVTSSPNLKLSAPFSGEAVLHLTKMVDHQVAIPELSQKTLLPFVLNNPSMLQPSCNVP